LQPFEEGRQFLRCAFCGSKAAAQAATQRHRQQAAAQAARQRHRQQGSGTGSKAEAQAARQRHRQCWLPACSYGWAVSTMTQWPFCKLCVGAIGASCNVCWEVSSPALSR
jgi:hypothetical protein